MGVRGKKIKKRTQPVQIISKLYSASGFKEIHEFQGCSSFQHLDCPQMARQDVANMGWKPRGDGSGRLSLALPEATEKECLSGGGPQGISDHFH